MKDKHTLKNVITPELAEVLRKFLKDVTYDREIVSGALEKLAFYHFYHQAIRKLNKISPEPKPLIIPWDMVPDKYTKAVYIQSENEIWFEGQYVDDYFLPADFLRLDLTDVCDKAECYRNS